MILSCSLVTRHEHTLSFLFWIHTELLNVCNCLDYLYSETSQVPDQRGNPKLRTEGMVMCCFWSGISHTSWGDDRRVWSNSDMMISKRTTRRKTCSTAALSTRNLTWSHPVLNPGLRGKKPESSRLIKVQYVRACTYHTYYSRTMTNFVCLTVSIRVEIMSLSVCDENRGVIRLRGTLRCNVQKGKR
jgi:hypothetical protein